MSHPLNKVHQGAAWLVAVIGLLGIINVGIYTAFAAFAYFVNREAYYTLPVNGRLALLTLAILVWVTVGSWNKKIKLENARV